MAVPADALVYQRHETSAPEPAAYVAVPRSRALSTWGKFRSNRLSYYSLLILATAFFISLFAEFLSNEKPLVIRYDGELRFPILHQYSERDYGGVLLTPAIYHDTYIQEQLAKPGNWAIFPPNQWDYQTMNYWTQESHPFPPSRSNWLGTDIIGRDVLARLLYAFRLSILFALSLTIAGTVIGVFLGAIQGYFGGKIDLVIQRMSEVWGSLPELYLLIIFASFFEPSLMLLFCLLSLFGWMLLADYVRAEFLRNRQLEYVKAARAMGLSHGQIIWRHILPNSLVPVITFLPFRMSAAIMALTSLDFLGLGVKAPTPSFGDMLAQGKAYLYAWWISVPAFLVLVSTLLLLTFIGEGVRDALDARRTRNDFRRG